MRSRLRQVPPALAALLATGALLALAWSLVLPPLQGPDETTHISGVTHLVEDGSLSTRLTRELRVLEVEGTLGPLMGNVAARPPSGDLARAQIDAALEALGDTATEPVSELDSPPTRGFAYSVWQAPAYAVASGGSVFDRLLAMRLWNIPLLLVTIAACWFLVAEVLPGAPLARVAAAGLAALQPQTAFLAGVVNPDTLLIACFAVFCAAAARLLRRGIAPVPAALLGASALAATATHARGAVLVPCAILVLLLAVPWRRLSPQARRRSLVAVGVAVPLVAGAVVALAAVLDLSLTEGEQVIRQNNPVLGFGSYVWQFYLPGLPFMSEPIGGDAYGFRQVGLESGWGAFASLEVTFPAWVYDLVGAALAIVVVAAVVAVGRRGVRPEAGWRLLVVLATVAVGTLGLLHFSAYRLLLVDPTDPVIVGRHVLVLLAPLALVLGLAIAGLGRRAAPLAVSTVLGLLAALDLAGLGLTVTRFYA